MAASQLAGSNYVGSRFFKQIPVPECTTAYSKWSMRSSDLTGCRDQRISAGSHEYGQHELLNCAPEHSAVFSVCTVVVRAQGDMAVYVYIWAALNPGRKRPNAAKPKLGFTGDMAKKRLCGPTSSQIGPQFSLPAATQRPQVARLGRIRSFCPGLSRNDPGPGRLDRVIPSRFKLAKRGSSAPASKIRFFLTV